MDGIKGITSTGDPPLKSAGIALGIHDSIVSGRKVLHYLSLIIDKGVNVSEQFIDHGTIFSRCSIGDVLFQIEFHPHIPHFLMDQPDQSFLVSIGQGV